jgi:hypothetical protein
MSRIRALPSRDRQGVGHRALPKTMSGVAAKQPRSNAGSRFLLIAVFGSVMLACLFGMMGSVSLMALRHVRLVTGLAMIAGVVMFRGRVMMLSGMLVVLSGFAVMFRSLFRHGLPPGRMISSLDFRRMKVM